MIPELGEHTALIRGTGDNRRTVMVKPIYDMGLERTAALINWHTLTGCDTTGRINVKDKEPCFKLFLEAEVTIIYQLGIGDEPTVEVLQGCMRIVFL